MTYSEEDRERLKRYHPGCLRGEHTPVAVADKHNRVIEVSCQNCFIPMTKEQHREYFKNKWRHRSDWKDFITLNYDEPGDPNDVDTYS